MESFVGKLVFPGQIVGELEEESTSQKIVMGPGLKNDTGIITVTKPGVIRRKDPAFYWVDCLQKRYIPAKGDSVLGIVINKSGDSFKIDVGSSEPANLSYLAFESATKRNRPDVKVGDVVFAKYSMASKHVEAELVCVDSIGRSNGYGVIRDGGFMFNCSINLARKLLRPDCRLLASLGNRIPYEISVGMNGRVWIKCRSTAETITVMNAIYCAETMNNAEIRNMVTHMEGVVPHLPDKDTT